MKKTFHKRELISLHQNMIIIGINLVFTSDLILTSSYISNQLLLYFYIIYPIKLC